MRWRSGWSPGGPPLRGGSRRGGIARPGARGGASFGRGALARVSSGRASLARASLARASLACASLACASLAAAAGCGDGGADSDVVRVAAASNFMAAQQALAERFETLSGVRVVSSFGSTGHLYAQIVNGAPFHVLLAADEERPRRLEQDGHAAAGSRFTYAVGRLALYGRELRLLGAETRTQTQAAGALGTPGVRVAIANPETAPYGAAALDVLERLDLLAPLLSRLARGESVAQVQHFVRSGAAELGFVALAQVLSEPPASYWLVPAELHRPIRQDAVLLGAGAAHAGARAYLAFLKGPEARSILEQHGYEVARSEGSGDFPREDFPREDFTGEGVAGDEVAREGVAGEGVAGEGVAGEGVAGEGVAGKGVRAEGGTGHQAAEKGR